MPHACNSENYYAQKQVMNKNYYKIRMRLIGDVK